MSFSSPFSRGAGSGLEPLISGLAVQCSTSVLAPIALIDFIPWGVLRVRRFGLGVAAVFRDELFPCFDQALGRRNDVVVAARLPGGEKVPLTFGRN